MEKHPKNDNIPDHETRISQSDEIGTQMYGKNWDAIVDNLNDLDPTFAAFVREIPYGSVYPREGLRMEYREIAAVTTLTQMNLKPQLKSHLISALRIGITENELRELFLHLAMFIGYPPALSGLRVLKEVIDEKNDK